MSTRLSVNINDATAKTLRDTVDSNGVTITEAVRRAVAVYEFFDQARRRGDTIQVVDACGCTKTVELLA